MNIDYTKLPPLVAEILQGFFHPLAMDIDDLSLLNAINVKLAQVFSGKRIKFEGNQGDAIINYYAINICPSGGGKDASLNLLNKYVFKDFKDKFYQERKEFVEQSEFDLTEELAKKYAGRKGSANKIEKEVKDFVDAVRVLHYEENPKTPEGFYESCLGFMNYGKGCVFVRNSEFASTMKNAKPDKLASYDIIMDASEGSLSVTTTKGEKKAQHVEGVPVNLVFVTDGSILVEDKKAKDLFLSYLQKGYARRSCISYQSVPDIKYRPDPEKAEEERQNAFTKGRTLACQLEIIARKIPNNTVLKMNRGAKNMLHLYDERCKKETELNQGVENNIILVDIRQRFWKAYKLAALICCITNYENLVITEKEVQMAIYQVELFHESLKQYIGTKPKSDHEKVFQYLHKNPAGVTTTDLRSQNFVWHNNFKKWWEEVYEHVEAFADSKGFSLEQEKGKGRTVRYRLIKKNIGTALSPTTTPPEMIMEDM